MRPPGARQGKSTLPVPEAALLERLGVSLDRGQAQVLEAYGKLVARWNRVGRLVAKGDLCRFASRHLLDSLVLVPLIRELEGSGDASGRTQAQDHEAPLPIADFGSGAGLPGIPLAIALPDLSFTLVERSAKKARFLRRVQDELTLLNVRVLCTDIRDLPRAAYRGVVARAVMPVPALWPRARAALTPGGYLLVLDSIARCRDALQPASQELCEGGAVRRHWVEMQELHAWHGVLEVRETSP